MTDACIPSPLNHSPKIIRSKFHIFVNISPNKAPEYYSLSGLHPMQNLPSFFQKCIPDEINRKNRIYVYALPLWLKCGLYSYKLVRDSITTVRVFFICQLGFWAGQLGFWFGSQFKNAFLAGKLGE